MFNLEIYQICPKNWGHSRFTGIKNNLDKYIKAKDLALSSELLAGFIDDLKWLYHGTRSHASVDTFAKKLYIKQEWDKLEKLKFMLSAYLTIEQIINPPDNRYDKFFATILGHEIDDLPDHMNILSWNYDFQLELAYKEFTNYEDLPSNANSLNILTKDIRRRNKRGFSIVKLNGTAGVNDSGTRNGYILDKIDESALNNLFDSILKDYQEVVLNKPKKLTSTISFAWEEDKQVQKSKSNIIDIAKEKVAGSDSIVIIGYSFPYFNADIDKKIFQGLDHSRIRYFVQDPKPDKVVESIREITGYKSDLKVEEIDYTEEFFIPYDFFG